MKRIVCFMIGLFFFCFLINLVYSDCSREVPCCCQEYPGGEKKCFTEGICCYEGIETKEFWNPESCQHFKVWVEPERGMFTVGSKNRINLYIKNLGYADNYYVTYNVSAENPFLIQVDMTGASPVYGVAFEETRIVYPRITVLESHTSGEVFFNVTSEGSGMNISRNATLTIIESDLPLSLPEFDFFGLIGIIFLASFLYYKKRE